MTEIGEHASSGRAGTVAAKIFKLIDPEGEPLLDDVCEAASLIQQAIDAAVAEHDNERARRQLENAEQLTRPFTDEERMVITLSAKNERAAIVAYAKREGHASKDDIERHAILWLAGRIEAGEHLKENASE